MTLRTMKDVLHTWRPRRGVETPFEAIRRAWPLIVGAHLAASTAPRAIEATTLVVTTTSGTWSQELGLFERAILTAIGELVPGSEITALRFRIGRLASTAIRRPARKTEQARLALRTDPPPVTSLEELKVRIGQAIAARARRRRPSCTACGISLDRSGLCAPCAGILVEQRIVAASRLLADAPWLSYDVIAEYLPRLSREEYARSRRSLLSRWERHVTFLRLRTRHVPTATDRAIVLAYALLVTGFLPTDLTRPVLRNLIGPGLEERLYGTDEEPLHGWRTKDLYPKGKHGNVYRRTD